MHDNNYGFVHARYRRQERHCHAAQQAVRHMLNLFLGYHPYYINIYNDKKLYFMISASGE